MRRWRSGGIGAVAAAVMLLAIAGCAPASFVERSYPGVPPGAEPLTPSAPTPGALGLPDPDLGPRVQWAEAPGVLAISLWGSSSCPVEPRSLREVGRDRVEVAVHRSGGLFGVCTADLAVTTYEVRVPGAASRTTDLTVVVDESEFTLAPRPASGDDDAR